MGRRDRGPSALGLPGSLRRLPWRRLAPTVALLSTAVVVGGVWAVGGPGSLVLADPSPTPTTVTPTHATDSPTPWPPVVTSSSPGNSVTPTPTKPTSLEPTDFPTIPECIAPRRFSVLTFNIHGGRTAHGIDLAAVAAEIRRARADVVLLQEVDQNLARTGFLDQPAILGKYLDMPVYYRASSRSNAILTRFPVTSWSSSALPGAVGKEERRLVRASMIVEGQLVHVFNTHLDHTSAELRLAQMRAVTALMAKYSDQPLVLGGDLNASSRGPVLETARSYLRDAWPGVGSGPGGTVPAQNPRARIDYVLHNSWLTARAAQVLPTSASDHRPLRIAFDLWGTMDCGE